MKIIRRLIEENNLYSSSSVIEVIKSRRMRWVRQVARIMAVKDAYNILVGKPEWKVTLGGLCLDVMILLKCILKK
jgi:hypothetical protein